MAITAYLDMSLTEADTATLAFTIGDATNNQWKIKVSSVLSFQTRQFIRFQVTQYSCDDECISAQEGCFQYHRGITGTIQSYNFAGSAQLQGQNYKNCIRQEEGYCCIQYTVNTYTINAATCVDVDNLCVGAVACSIDYILIPNTITTGLLNYDRCAASNLRQTKQQHIVGFVEST